MVDHNLGIKRKKTSNVGFVVCISSASSAASAPPSCYTAPHQRYLHPNPAHKIYHPAVFGCSQSGFWNPNTLTFLIWPFLHFGCFLPLNFEVAQSLDIFAMLGCLDQTRLGSRARLELDLGCSCFSICESENIYSV